MSDEIERLRATNTRLNRRAQVAEAALHELTTTTGRGKSRAVAAEVWARCVGTHEAACSRVREARAEELDFVAAEFERSANRIEKAKGATERTKFMREVVEVLRNRADEVRRG